MENFTGAKVVEARDATLEITLHGMCLARSGLTIGETGYFGALECVLYEGPDAKSVNLFVGGGLIEGIVKVEGGFFQVLSEIDFLPAWGWGYLCSLMVTCPPGDTLTMSDSERCTSLRFRGRLRMATVILGVSANFIVRFK